MKIRNLFLGTTAVLALLPITPAFAAPSNYTVAAGDATVATVGLVTTITQTTERSVIEWDSFNLASPETVNFVVPAVTSATLNRIADAAGTTVSGTVNSNGVVYFVNPNGLVFDATSRVSATGFVAFTGAISDDDFMTKSHAELDLSSRGTGAISLNGDISLPQINGFVGPTLVAAHGGSVAIAGTITVAKGSLSLVSTTATTIGENAVISASDNGYAAAGNISLSSEQAATVAGSLTADRGSLSIGAPTITVSGSLSALLGEVRLQSTTRTSLSSTAILSATVDQFGRNGLIRLASDAELELGGTYSATRGKIVGSGSTITVSGQLTAKNGAIELSSSLGTTIDATGVLSVDADIMGNSGGTVAIVAGETVSVAGTITARGNEKHGLGGTMKIAGKTGLSLEGTIDSSAATGALGSLQLGAATVEIGSGSTAGITYMTADKLRQLSTKNNLVIDTSLAQPADDQGSVTVNEAVELTSSLSLIGRSLTINQPLKAGGDLILKQVGATAGDGISLTGVGLTAGRDMTLDQSGTVGSGKAGIVFSGSGVALAAGGAARNWIVLRSRSTTGLSLLGNERFDLSTAMVRLELGTGAMVSESGQNRSLNASNLAVFYSGAQSGNSATLMIGKGSLTVLLDRQGQADPLVLNDQSQLSDLGWTDDQAFVAATTPNSTPGLNSFERGGLTVVSRGGIDSVNQIGLSSGGTVEISGIKTGALARLSLIEAKGISLTAASEFAHSLTLIANGTGITTATGVFGISLQANLKIGLDGDRLANLTLVQNGEVFGTGIRMSGAEITVGGSLNSQQNRSFFGTGLKASKTTLTIGGELNLWQAADFFVDGMLLHEVTAKVTGDIRISQNADPTRYFLVVGQSIEIQNSELTAGGQAVIEQGGGTSNNGLRFDSVKIKSGGSVVIRQTGAAELNGILMRELDIHSGQDLSILQTGRVGEGYSGIRFEAQDWAENKKAWGVSLFGGNAALNWITLSSRAKIGLTLAGFDNFDVNSAQVRIDLGTGTMVSEFPTPVIKTPTPTPPLPVVTPTPAPVIPKTYSLNSNGLTVYYTGATTGNQARLVVNSGDFVFVTDRRAQTGTVVIDNQLARGNNTNGWGVGLGFVASNLSSSEYGTYINASGLKVKTYGELASVTKMGLV
ncbi:MAG: filamentous hemagglutinin N-terminal domain-containing protein, partial [Alphaproteobacteria bacterium]|nr:filamentous hemagglutinin N-terminal domain-containing protein [Alphaproteobacteria bacterium]